MRLPSPTDLQQVRADALGALDAIGLRVTSTGIGMYIVCYDWPDDEVPAETVTIREHPKHGVMLWATRPAAARVAIYRPAPSSVRRRGP